MDKTKFYNSIRAKINLTTQNVIGFEKVLDYAELVKPRLNDLAYIIATAFWESAQTMHPVKEAYWLDEAWRKKNLRYYPWYGRGLVQTTWEANYVKMGKVLGVDFTKKPDLLLEWEYALPALFVGMEKGLYTGRKIVDYIDDIDESDTEDLREFKEARRIVNGTDKAETIGKLALIFEKGLRAAGYVQGFPVKVPDVVVQPIVVVDAPKVPETENTPVAASKSIFTIIMELIAKMMGVRNV